VAMEATGIYSMPVYHALIEHGDFEKVLVCNAGHVKNVPGRKTGLADAEWLVQLECGLLAGSFIPPADIKAARDVIRYRAKVVQSRTSEVQRLGNVLQDAGIKIDSVASSIVTKSGRSMIESLIDGERRPAVLADLALGRMRVKIPDLTLALEGRFGEHHALMCRLHLDHIDHLEAMIARLDAQIEAMMAPFRAARDLLTTIPGIGPLSPARHEMGRLPQPARQEESDHRGRPRDPGDHLACPGHRQTLRRTRRRLLHPPRRPRTRNRPPHRETRSPRPHRHPGTSRLTTRR